MNKKLKVSIITPNYNRADFIAETLESVMNQTSQDWECIIVDDGSTDNSVKIIKDFVKRDSRFKLYHRDREPKGACTCRNIGVENSEGDYLIFLDSDDILAPHCVEQRLTAISQQPELDYAVFPMLLFEKTPYDTMKLWNIETEESDLKRLLKLDPIAQGSGQLWKKTAFQKIGAWNENLKVWQDIYLQINAFINNFQNKTFFNLEPDLFIRNSAPDSISRVGFNDKEKITSRADVFLYAAQNIPRLRINANVLKYMAWGLISSSIQTRRFALAGKLIKESSQKEILNPKQTALLRKATLLHKLRLYKIPAVKKHLNSIYAFMSYEKQLGKKTYKKNN